MNRMTKIDWVNRSLFFNNKELKYLNNFLRKSDNLTQSNELLKFENGLKGYLKTKNINAVSSAASSLEIIALLLKLKKNDEIIIPAHTYCASALPFMRNGAKIIWADIDFKTRVISLDDIKKKISKKTKAIVIVHLYGYAADVFKIKKYLKNKKIKIIEDCAQAFGAEIKGKKVGTIGDFSCYSFHAQKNLTTLGEGGAIYVKDKSLFKKVKGLRHNGHSNFKKRKFYWLPAMGNLELDLIDKLPFKATLSEIQCASGHLLLKRIDQLNKKRISRARKFISHFKHNDVLSFNESFLKKRHVYHLLSAYVKPSKNFNRNTLIKELYDNYQIKCATQYYPLYKYSLFKKYGYGKGKCLNTEKFYNNMISFPFHVWMSEKNFDYMISSVKKILDKYSV